MIVQKGDIPLSIACESIGTYTSFKMNEVGKSVLLKGTERQGAVRREGWYDLRLLASSSFRSLETA
jgi:hypothetical protein